MLIYNFNNFRTKIVNFGRFLVIFSPNLEAARVTGLLAGFFKLGNLNKKCGNNENKRNLQNSIEFL